MVTDEPAPPQTSPEHSRARRDQIVEAAYGCLGDTGLPGLRMRDVAARAGVNIATVHYHVPGKAELIRAVVTHAHALFQERTAPPPGTAPRLRVREHLTRVFDLLAADPLLGRVLAEVALHAERDPATARIVEAAERRWRDALRAMLPDRTRHPGQLVHMIVYGVKGACLPPVDPGGLRSARQAFLRTVDLWLNEPR